MYGYPAVLKGGFADVDNTWQWGHMSAPFSLFYLICPVKTAVAGRLTGAFLLDA
jgi:hypothetical protein